MATATLVCPSCQQEMYKLERSGVVIDRCSHCGGVFLERGELQALLKAETDFHASITAPFEPVEEEEDDEDPSSKRATRRGFLDELLDIG
jgi:uncharacterized protein